MRLLRRSRGCCDTAAGTCGEAIAWIGARFGGMFVCLCSRITLADNTMAILVISTERADIALPERARRLLADAQLRGR